MIDTQRVKGWAWDKARPDQAISVDFWIDDKVVRTERADILGSDLFARGMGSGEHRWYCSLNDLTEDQAVHTLRVRFAGTDMELTNSPKVYCVGALDVVADLDMQAILASRYIRGEGIEIGALNTPLAVPLHAHVKYVDWCSTDDLRAEYAAYANFDLVHVDIIDDGEKLSTLQDDSQDFVIANNVLEHCQDPIGTLRNWLRVLRSAGVAYIIIPNRRGHVDRARPETPVKHLVADHENGPEPSRKGHYLEWARMLMPEASDAEVEAHAAELMLVNYSIHFHVFTEFEMMEVLLELKRRYGLRFIVEQVANNVGIEGIVVLRKE